MTQNNTIDIGRTSPPDILFETLRTRALKQLLKNGSLGKKCSTIIAPIGYGKTVLMSTLWSELHLNDKQCFWLTINEHDLSIDRILKDLAYVLQGADKQKNHTIFSSLEPYDIKINSIISAINNYSLPVVIFLDNLNFCADPALSLLLDKLIFTTRSSVQLVFSSTEELPIDLPRAKMEGLLYPIGSNNLNFSVNEITDLLGKHLLEQLGISGVYEVFQKTEGWPAAIRMIQIILNDSNDPIAALNTFSGTDETLTHLLNKQVLSTFSEESRLFLLSLAQLKTFSRELCLNCIDVKNEGKQQLFDHLLEKKIFIIPLDQNRQWYRLHGLFREFLIQEAEDELPNQHRQDITLRAITWCKNNGYQRDALDYAIKSKLFNEAIPIIDNSAAFFVRDLGITLQFINWVEELHAQDMKVGLKALYWFIWALTFHRRYALAHQHITRLTEKITTDKNNEHQGLLPHIVILRSSIDSLSDQLSDAHAGASQWLQNVSPLKDIDPFDLTAAHCIKSCHYSNNLDFIEARRSIQSARESAFQSNSLYVDGWVSSYAALIDIHEGNFNNAYHQLTKTLKIVKSTLGENSSICGTMSLVASCCAAEMGLTLDARQLLEFGMRTVHSDGFPDAIICGIRAALLAWPDNNSFSLQSLKELANTYPVRLSFELSCYLIRRHIALSQIDEALNEASSIGLERLTQKEFKHYYNNEQLHSLFIITKIELQIATGHNKRALPIITEELQRNKSSGCYINIVSLELNGAIIALKTQDYAMGVRHVTRAIRIAHSRRIKRPFLDRIDRLTTLVTELKPSVWGFATQGERDFFDELFQHLYKINATTSPEQKNQQEKPFLLDDLTPREQDLLRLIDAGLSNQQIADHIDTSINTVKWHLQNLFGKLGVSRRTAAIKKAKSLNLFIK